MKLTTFTQLTEASAGRHTSKGRARSTGGESGFTLTDLTVLVGMVGFLAVLLVVTVGAARPNSAALQCLNNFRQLMGATLMYSCDYNDLMLPNIDDGLAPPGYDWVKGDVDGWMPSPATGGSADAGNPDLLQNPKTSLLAPYLGYSVSIFKCPTDPRIAPYTGLDTARRGQLIPVVRSCSLNQGVGTITPSPHLLQGSPTVPVNGPWLDGNHTHISGHPYATFGKITSFGIIGPSEVWTFVDDDPWTINDDTMAVIAAVPQFVDYCSTFHNNATSFAFADGHAEMHKWKSDLFIHVGVPARTAAAPGLQYGDWFWWASHATRSYVTGTVP